MQQPVSGEIKSIDLDFHFIAGMHETDVMVAHHGFDLQLTVAGHDHHQGLGGRHHAADRVYGQLLNHARHRRGQLLKLGALLGLRQIGRKAGGFSLGLGQLAEQRSAILGLGLGTCFDDGGNCCLCFL